MARLLCTGAARAVRLFDARRDLGSGVRVVGATQRECRCDLLLPMTLVEIAPEAPAPAPAVGQLARVRGRIWVVGGVARDSQASLDGRPMQHLVSLISVEDDATGEELEVVWEIEPGTSVIERAELPVIATDRVDDPAELDAVLDAVRWGG